MIRRGADEGQAEGDVDAAVEGQRLDRNQRLVVIHADRGVIGFPRLGVKHRIGGKGPAGDETPRGQAENRRRDNVDVFPAQGSVFAGVRVEAGKGQPWLGYAEIPAQRLPDDGADFHEIIGGEQRGDLRQRDVNGGGHNGEFARPDHHHRAAFAAEMFARQFPQKFGMTGMGETGFIEHGLGNRIGDNGGGPPLRDKFDAAKNGFDRRRGVGRIGTPRRARDLGAQRNHGQSSFEIRGGVFRRGGDGMDVKAKQRRPADQKIGVGQNTKKIGLDGETASADRRVERQRDIGADAGRITLGKAKRLQPR